MALFTALGVALSKYHPERVMEHLRLFWSRLNTQKMLRACEEAHLWPELVFLYGKLSLPLSILIQLTDGTLQCMMMSQTMQQLQ